jgi:hypothetical protein
MFMCAYVLVVHCSSHLYSFLVNTNPSFLSYAEIGLVKQLRIDTSLSIEMWTALWTRLIQLLHHLIRGIYI